MGTFRFKVWRLAVAWPGTIRVQGYRRLVGPVWWRVT